MEWGERLVSGRYIREMLQEPYGGSRAGAGQAPSILRVRVALSAFLTEERRPMCG